MKTKIIYVVLSVVIVGSAAVLFFLNGKIKASETPGTILYGMGFNAGQKPLVAANEGLFTVSGDLLKFEAGDHLIALPENYSGDIMISSIGDQPTVSLYLSQDLFQECAPDNKKAVIDSFLNCQDGQCSRYIESITINVSRSDLKQENGLKEWIEKWQNRRQQKAPIRGFFFCILEFIF